MRIKINDLTISVRLAKRNLGLPLEDDLKNQAAANYFKIHAIFAAFQLETEKLIDPLKGCSDLIAKKVDFSFPRPKDTFFKLPLRFLHTLRTSEKLGFQLSDTVKTEIFATQYVIKFALQQKEVTPEMLQIEHETLLQDLGKDRVTEIINQYDLADLIGKERRARPRLPSQTFRASR